MIQIASREEILDAVEAALNELTNEFIRNPMRFFSEKDFHWYFCCLLNMNELVKTKFNGYKTMIVHQEYGTVGRKGNRTDIAVLDPEDVKEVKGPDLKLNETFLHPLAAIEFGTEKTSKLLEHIKKDCKKLEEIGPKTKKYMVIFYRDRTKSKEGQRHQKHHDKMKALKEKVKEARKLGLKIICVIYDVDRHKYKEY